MTRLMFHRLCLPCLHLAHWRFPIRQPRLETVASVYASYQSCVSYGSCSPYSSPAEYGCRLSAVFSGWFSGVPGAGERFLVPADRRDFVVALLAPAGRRRSDPGEPALRCKAWRRAARMPGTSGAAWPRAIRVSPTRSGVTRRNMTSMSPMLWSAWITPLLRTWYWAFPAPSTAAQAAPSRMRRPQGRRRPSRATPSRPISAISSARSFALDASIGFGSGKNSSGGNMESEGDRLFYAANLNYSRWVKDLQFPASSATCMARRISATPRSTARRMNNTAAKNKLDRWLFGVQAGYWMGDGVQPYAGLSYLADRRSSSQAAPIRSARVPGNGRSA
jgi:hypothetical protein